MRYVHDGIKREAPARLVQVDPEGLLPPYRVRPVSAQTVEKPKAKQDALYAEVHCLPRAPSSYYEWYDEVCSRPWDRGGEYAYQRMQDFVTEDIQTRTERQEADKAQLQRSPDWKGPCETIALATKKFLKNNYGTGISLGLLALWECASFLPGENPRAWPVMVATGVFWLGWTVLCKIMKP